MLKRLNAEGWQLARQSGSHRQFKHHQTPDRRVTVAGKPGDTIAEGTRKSIFRQAGWEEQD